MDGTLAPIPDVLLPEYGCDVDVAVWSAQEVNSSYGLAGSVRGGGSESRCRAHQRGGRHCPGCYLPERPDQTHDIYPDTRSRAKPMRPAGRRSWRAPTGGG